jgi:hypothetical protein
LSIPQALLELEVVALRVEVELAREGMEVGQGRRLYKAEIQEAMEILEVVL